MVVCVTSFWNSCGRKLQRLHSAQQLTAAPAPQAHCRCAGCAPESNSPAQVRIESTATYDGDPSQPPLVGSARHLASSMVCCSATHPPASPVPAFHCAPFPLACSASSVSPMPAHSGSHRSSPSHRLSRRSCADSCWLTPGRPTELLRDAEAVPALLSLVREGGRPGGRAGTAGKSGRAGRADIWASQAERVHLQQRAHQVGYSSTNGNRLCLQLTAAGGGGGHIGCRVRRRIFFDRQQLLLGQAAGYPVLVHIAPLRLLAG